MIAVLWDMTPLMVEEVSTSKTLTNFCQATRCIYRKTENLTSTPVITSHVWKKSSWWLSLCHSVTLRMMTSYCSLIGGSIYRPDYNTEHTGSISPPKCLCPPPRPQHGVITQKTTIYICGIVETSNVICFVLVNTECRHLIGNSGKASWVPSIRHKDWNIQWYLG